VLLQWAMGATMAVWMAYVLNNSIDGQGVVGWVTDRAVQQFGSASDNLCVLAALAIGTIPIGLVFRVIAWRLGIRLLRHRRRGELPPGTPSQIRRGAVLAAVGISVAGVVLMLIAMPHDDGAPPLPFDLDAPGAAVPPDGSRVAVLGTPRPEIAAGYTESRGSTDTKVFQFIPLTPKDWTPQTPVRFFLAEVDRTHESPTGIVAVPGPDQRMRYHGQLRRNAMATLARGAFERHGVHVAATYWVIRNDGWEPMLRAIMIGGLGIVLGLVLIIVGWRDAQQVAARDARRPPPGPPPPPGGPTRGRPPTPPPIPQPRSSARAQHPAPPNRSRQVTPPPVPAIALRAQRPTPLPLPPGTLRRRPA